jgi:hypothetical protein
MLLTAVVLYTLESKSNRAVKYYKHMTIICMHFALWLQLKIDLKRHCSAGGLPPSNRYVVLLPLYK